MRKFVVIMLILLLGTAGCKVVSINEFDTVEEVKIGFVGPLSGDASSYGDPIYNAVELAVSEINNSGGINGKPINLIAEDGLCDETGATNAVNKLVNQNKVKFIIGGVCSGETLAMAPILNKTKVLSISPSSSSPDVTFAGDFVFRNTPSDADIGKALASVISKKYKTIAVISESTDYATDLRNVFVEEYQKNGGKVIYDELYSTMDSDYEKYLTEIKSLTPQAILINPQTEASGGKIVKQIFELGITTPLFGTNVVAGDTALKIAGKNAEGIVIVDNPSLDENNMTAFTFLRNYKKNYGEPSFEFYLGAAYDAVYLYKQAIEEHGFDTEEIRDYLYNLKNYSGVIGDYRFDKNGDLVWIDYSVKEIIDGEAVDIK